ncbi:unnamed protein product [Hermetia illucens]|uniref:Microsomal glutathione S-transferase 1 n=1 Tax=Hermetia illucens TaxID=343691 RepID=A0A7R8V348_HERIL|nr:unnamed protein product [Hermetia illucens]
MSSTFISPEDLFSKKSKVKYDDDDIERVRRAHRNDLENILPFLTIGFFYCLTDPEPWLAINLFRLVGISRIIHTFVYAVIVIPQPARFLSFILALLPTLYMTLQVIKFCF